MKPAKPIDANGREVMLGDWVRVIQAPISILGMPKESLSAFSRAIGHTFQVLSIQVSGDLELNMYPKVSADSIWIEPDCCVITRRATKLSKKFKQHLEDTARWDNERGRPEWRVQP